MSISQDQLDVCRDKFTAMIRFLGLTAEVEVESKNDRVQVNVKTDEPGRIIGRRGTTLSSLQMLLNGMLRRHDQDFPRVSLDVDGYKGERKKRGDEEGESERPPRERRERGGRDRGDREQRSDNREDRGGDRDRSDNREDRSGKSEPRSDNREPRSDNREDRSDNREDRSDNREDRSGSDQRSDSDQPEVRAVAEDSGDQRSAQNSDGAQPEARESGRGDADSRGRDQGRRNDRRDDRGGARREPRRDDRQAPEREERSRAPEDPAARLKSRALDAAAEVRKWGETIELPIRQPDESEKILEMFKDDAEVIVEAVSDSKIAIKLRG